MQYMNDVIVHFTCITLYFRNYCELKKGKSWYFTSDLWSLYIYHHHLLLTFYNIIATFPYKRVIIRRTMYTSFLELDGQLIYINNICFNKKVLGGIRSRVNNHFNPQGDRALTFWKRMNWFNAVESKTHGIQFWAKEEGKIKKVSCFCNTRGCLKHVSSQAYQTLYCHDQAI